MSNTGVIIEVMSLTWSLLHGYCFYISYLYTVMIILSFNRFYATFYCVLTFGMLEYIGHLFATPGVVA